MNKKIASYVGLYGLGLIYTAFGLAGLFNMLPPPKEIPEGAMAFSAAMFATGYFFPMVKLTESVCGLLLLSGYASPVALVILAPITLNIFLFHAWLTPGMGNLVIPVVMIVLHGLAALNYWHLYRPLFRRNPTA